MCKIFWSVLIYLKGSPESYIEIINISFKHFNLLEYVYKYTIENNHVSV